MVAGTEGLAVKSTTHVLAHVTCGHADCVGELSRLRDVRCKMPAGGHDWVIIPATAENATAALHATCPACLPARQEAGTG